MTDCPNAEMRDRLPDLLHEQLDASTRAAVMAHVEDCQDCRAELTLLRETRLVLSSDARVVDATRIARLVIERVPAARSARSSGRPWVDWRIAASVLLVAIGGTSLVMLRDRGVDEPPIAPVAVERPASAVGIGARRAPEPVASTAGVSAAQAPELLAAGAVSDLSDSELRALVDDLQTLDALPPADPEPVSVRVAVPGSSE